MATPADRLAASLAQLEELQRSGRRVFRTGELTRVHRERLVKNGFLREVVKGWLISSSPAVDPGDTTPWFASFWEFCVRYATDRFGHRWHLSPEQSVLLHAENTTIPQQVIIYTPAGTNNTVKLPYGTSLYDLKQEQFPPTADLTEREGLRLYTPEAALTKVSGAFLARNPVEAQVLMSGIRDPSDVLRHLLAGGHSTVAGRLAGAFRRIDRAGLADDLVSSMRAAGYDVRETDPFAPDHVFSMRNPVAAPIVKRLQAFMGDRPRASDPSLPAGSRYAS